jgi:hypothetical protein
MVAKHECTSATPRGPISARFERRAHTRSPQQRTAAARATPAYKQTHTHTHTETPTHANSPASGKKVCVVLVVLFPSNTLCCHSGIERVQLSAKQLEYFEKRSAFTSMSVCVWASAPRHHRTSVREKAVVKQFIGRDIRGGLLVRYHLSSSKEKKT